MFVAMLNPDLAIVEADATDVSFPSLSACTIVIDAPAEILWASIEPALASPKDIADSLYPDLAIHSCCYLSDRPRDMSNSPVLFVVLMILSSSLSFITATPFFLRYLDLLLLLHCEALAYEAVDIFANATLVFEPVVHLSRGATD